MSNFWRTPMIFLLCFSALAALPIAGCSGGGGGSDDGGGDGSTPLPPGGPTFDPSAIIQLLTTTASPTGRATVGFTLPAGSNKFSVVLEVPSGLTRFVTVESSTGVNYLAPSGSEVSLAGDPSPVAKAANAPSRDFDPAVTDSATYTATAVANPGDTVSFSVVSRSDGDLRSGTLQVNVFLVGSPPQQAETRAAIDQALIGMASILANAGIALNITQFAINGSDVLPDPTDGSSFYLAAASSATTPSVNLFVGGDLSIGGIDDSSTLGISSDIPGPPLPTDRSAVAISLTVSAGPNNSFSADETRLLGETFAHEIGHFMGLFHPIDLNGIRVAFTDPLPDTDECSSTTDCLTNDSLTRNLMFPFPVPDDTTSGGTLPQNQLTSQQSGVLNLYAAVQ